MAAASQAQAIATVKWVASAPTQPGSTVPSVSALICVSDYETGAPLAILDGDEITLIRTAAMSAAAASLLAPTTPSTIGFVGCGLQAHAHLAAFHDLYPGLANALMLSRSRGSSEHLAEAAAALGLATEIVDDADALLARSDLVISMVPAAPGLRPFLDPRRMKPAAFAAAVDTGRSWRPEALPGFDILATDSLAQSQSPYDVDGQPVTSVRFGHDLAALSLTPPGDTGTKRSLFCFRGFALADLALAHLVLEKARAAGIGISLPR
jgi:alanine dehydrogenase